jgi:putative FmdB family regulatory protein
MPIYEYECSNCRYYLEVIQKISDAKLRKCPSCGKNALKKLISAPVFRLKGSGWYETDFKGDQDKKRNLAGAEKEPPGDAKDAKGGKDGKDAKAAADSSTDSKADTKAEAKGEAGDKPAAKGESKADKPEAAGGKDHKSKSSKPSPKAKPAPKRAAAKPASKAAKRRGRR